MEENNKMKNEPVNKLMLQMGVPMILSMALQAVYNIVDSAFVGNMKEGSETALNDGGLSHWYRCWSKRLTRKNFGAEKS